MHCKAVQGDEQGGSHVCEGAVFVGAVVFSPDGSAEEVGVGREGAHVDRVAARAQLHGALCAVEVRLLARRDVAYCRDAACPPPDRPTHRIVFSRFR